MHFNSDTSTSLSQFVFIPCLKTNEDLYEVLLWHDLQFVVLKYADCHKSQPLPCASAKTMHSVLTCLTIRALLAVETGVGIPAAGVKWNLFRKPLGL